MRALTSRERQIGALTLLAILLIGLWYLLIELPFLAPMRTSEQEAATLREQQRHYAAMLAQTERIEAALNEARHDPLLSDSLLPGNDPNAAAATLMQLSLDRIDEYARQGPGCRVTQRMPMAAAGKAEDSPYRQVQVSLSLECAIEPLTNVLYAFEYDQPSLFIDQLNIHRDSRASPAGGPGRLSVNLLLRGYLRAPAKENET